MKSHSRCQYVQPQLMDATLRCLSLFLARLLFLLPTGSSLPLRFLTLIFVALNLISMIWFEKLGVIAMLMFMFSFSWHFLLSYCFDDEDLSLTCLLFFDDSFILMFVAVSSKRSSTWIAQLTLSRWVSVYHSCFIMLNLTFLVQVYRLVGWLKTKLVFWPRPFRAIWVRFCFAVVVDVFIRDGGWYRWIVSFLCHRRLWVYIDCQKMYTHFIQSLIRVQGPCTLVVITLCSTAAIRMSW